jgi:flagellar hook-basal body complex protein FliE
MEELKKIKLIEILEMDESTSIKFFARRSEHQKKIEGLHKTAKLQIDQLDELIKDEKNSSDQVLKKSIDEISQIQENISRERQSFIKSAAEILTPIQMAKLVVFEERFRDEVSGILFKERFKKRRDE